MSEREQCGATQSGNNWRTCTLPKGHDSMHRDGDGIYWVFDDRASRLPAPVSQPVAAQEEAELCDGCRKPQSFHWKGWSKSQGCWGRAVSSPRAEASESAGDDGLQQRVDAAWAKYRSSVHGDFDVYARMHFASGYRAASQPSTLPQSSVQAQGFEEWWKTSIHGTVWNIDDERRRMAAKCSARAAWTAAQSQPVAEKEQLVSDEPNWKEIALSLADDETCRYDHHGYCQTHLLHEHPCPCEVVQQYRQRFGKKAQ